MDIETSADEQQTVRIVIKTINNETHEFHVPRDFPVTSLKERVRISTSIAEERQRLIYRGQVLVDENNLATYKIEDGQTIHMVARPENFRELRETASQAPTQTESAAASRGARFSPLSAILGSTAGGGDLASVLNTSFLSLLGPSREPVRAEPPALDASLEHVRQGILTMHTLLSTMDTQHLGISDAENHHSGLSSQSLRGAVCGRALQGDFAAAATADSGKASFEDGIAAAKSHSLQSQTGPFDGSMLSGSNRLSTSPAAAASSSGAATSASCAEAADENSPESASFLPPSSSESKRFFVGQWIDVKDTVNQWLEATVMAVNEEQGTVFLHYNGWPTRWDEWIQIDSPRIAPFRTRTLHQSTSAHVSPSPNSVVANAPATGIDDVRLLLPEIADMVSRLSPALSEASHLAERSFSSEPIALNRSPAADTPIASNMPWRLSPEKRGEKGEEAFLDRETSGRDAEFRLRLLAGELSPLLDRLGRVLADIAPHLRTFSDSPSRQFREESSEDKALEPLREQGNGSVSGSTVSDTVGEADAAFPSTRGREQSTAATPIVAGGGFDALEALTTLLRNRRAPSPPQELAYRQNISTAVSRGGISSPNSNGGHLDIHIHAILTPLARAASVNAASPDTNSSPISGAAALSGDFTARRENMSPSLDRGSAITSLLSGATTTGLMNAQQQQRNQQPQEGQDDLSSPVSSSGDECVSGESSPRANDETSYIPENWPIDSQNDDIGAPQSSLFIPLLEGLGLSDSTTASETTSTINGDEFQHHSRAAPSDDHSRVGEKDTASDSPVLSLRKQLPVRQRIRTVATSDSSSLGNSSIISPSRGFTEEETNEHIALAVNRLMSRQIEDEQLSMMCAEYIEDRYPQASRGGIGQTLRHINYSSDSRGAPTVTRDYEVERTSGGTCVLSPRRAETSLNLGSSACRIRSASNSPLTGAYRGGNSAFSGLPIDRAAAISTNNSSIQNQSSTPPGKYLSASPRSGSGSSGSSARQSLASSSSAGSGASSTPSPKRPNKTIRFPKVEDSDSESVIAELSENSNDGCLRSSKFA